MSKPVIAFGLALGLGLASTTDAQVVVGWPSSSGSPAGVSYMATGGDYVAPYQGHALIPYSYYAAYPQPARTYVGYGSHDFPFRGRAYGSPNDPWSWYYMGGPSRYLARYYYPPL